MGGAQLEAEGHRSPQKLEEARRDSPLELSEAAQPCPHLDPGRLASRTVREYISVVVSHPVCGTS